jgi:hypothetical protein
VNHLRVALLQLAAQTADRDRRAMLETMSMHLRGLVSDHTRQVAETLLGLTRIPDETWHGPLPPTDGAKDELSFAIDRLSADWEMGTDLHKLVSLRRVAWAATQLARVMEKKLDDAAKQP